jgi:hypothetical protein
MDPPSEHAKLQPRVRSTGPVNSVPRSCGGHEACCSGRHDPAQSSDPPPSIPDPDPVPPAATPNLPEARARGEISGCVIAGALDLEVGLELGLLALGLLGLRRRRG